MNETVGIEVADELSIEYILESMRNLKELKHSNGSKALGME
jgi:hypothetical protein